ncbi:Rhamnolipids biosynthesis 3-oxoacyl- reductase [Penicillium chermesinum]|nr:Rhamnolipids biosynthesis 3-oxoacyl- reductase [Penicillium chermesinum]
MAKSSLWPLFLTNDLLGGGIGRMIARGCAANGAHTILIDVNEQGLCETVEELQRTISDSKYSSLETHAIHGDLSSEDGVKEIVAKVKALQNPVDALIHCAGVRYMNETIYSPGDSLRTLEAATLSASYGDWERTFRLNVLAPYYLTAGLIVPLGEAASRGEGRGCVLFFSSPASVHNHQFVPSYQTSKAAVDHLVRIMATEFADFYIRVNAISPGIVPSRDDDRGCKLQSAFGKRSPAGRAGNDEDMVGTALWLMSKAGSFMDGKVVRVEGGRLLILKGVTSNSD